MRRERLLDVAVTVLTLCAVVTTGLVVRQQIFPARPRVPKPRAVPEWRMFAREGHLMGPASAPVKIVVFSDFQCPFCALLTMRLRTVRSEYPTQVAVVYRHFPLRIHHGAVGAARASECAALQGRFEPIYNALFTTQDSIGRVPWEYFAGKAGISDIGAFGKCVASRVPFPNVARDTLAGQALEVHGTPTLLINGTLLEGTPPLDTLEAYVQRALHRSS